MVRSFLRSSVCLVVLLVALPVRGQVSIVPGQSVTESFDALGTGIAAPLPAGWRADSQPVVRTVGTWGSAGTATTQRAGNRMSRTAPAGIYNMGAGAPTAATERAVGFLSTGVEGNSRPSSNLYVRLQNTGGATIERFRVAYNVEKYRRGVNPNGFRIQLFLSTDGVTWTTAGEAFRTFFGPDGTNSGYPAAPGVTVPVSGDLVVAVPAGGDLYLAWNYSVADGAVTTNAQALAVDNVTITAAAVEAPQIAVSGTLQTFTTLLGTPSAAQSYVVSGSNLTGNLTVTAPTGFQVSTGGGAFGSSVVLTPSGGTVPPTPLQVRLSGATIGTTSSLITHTSPGAGPVQVSVVGAVGNVYTWQATTGSGTWGTSTAWTPTRTTPTIADVLRFDRGGTPTVTAVPEQTVARVVVDGSTNVSFQAAATGSGVLAIEGPSPSLRIAAGAQLNLIGTTPLALDVPNEATASILGTMRFAGGAHRLIGDAPGSVVFGSGASAIGGTGLLNHPFAASDVGAGSIAFAPGSVYVRRDGANPVGAATVQFQAGSTYRHEIATAPAVAGLTYPNVEFNVPAALTLTGSQPWTLGALTVTQGAVEATGTLPIVIGGTVTVAAGQALALNTNSLVTLAGTAAQSIAGAGSLTIGPDARLAVDNPAGVTLTRALRLERELRLVSGTFATNDLLTLGARAGQIATITNAGGTLTGQVTYERLYAVPVSNWRLIGSPFQNVPFTTLNAEFHTQGAPAAQFPFGDPILFDYDPSQPAGFRWRVRPTYAETAEAGRGYIFYMFRDRIGGGEPHLPGTWRIVGQENAPVVARPLHYTATGPGTSFNLVANPLAGHLDWLAVRSGSTNLGATYYVWDPALGGTGAYRTYQGLKGFEEAGRYIPPFQAFWVVATGPSPSISFTEAMKDNAQSPLVVGRPDGMERGDPQGPTGMQAWLQFELEGEGLAASPLLAVFHEDAVPAPEEVDPVDAPWLQSLTADRIDAYFRTGVRRLVTEARPYGGAHELRLHVATTRPGTYTLTWPAEHALPETWTLRLLDHETGQEVDLRAEGAYTFSLGAALAAPGEALAPVDPTAYLSADDALLEGETRFGGRFSLFVSDGATSASEPVAPAALAVESAFPNPFREAVTVRYATPQSGTVRLVLYDILGREVARLFEGPAGAGVHTLRWDAAGLPSGVYLLRLTGGADTHTLRLVRTR